MDTVKNWYRSMPLGFNGPPRSQDYDSGTNHNMKASNYGTADRVMKTATNVCKKMAPSPETRSAMMNTVEQYGRKLMPKEATKQKVSRFYESQVAKLKYSQLKDGYQPGDRDDLQRFVEDDDFHGYGSEDHRVPEAASHTFAPISQPKPAPWDTSIRHSASADWDTSFMDHTATSKRF